MPADWVQDDAAQMVTAALSLKSFGRFASYITRELGIKMPESKMTMVQSRLLRRARELRLGSIDEYGEYFFAGSNSDEREYFINAITTNETDFFREPEHFDFLVKTALPNLLAGVDTRLSRLNVWSAACSSGQEPYTLGMILSEYASKSAGLNFAILGTDISTKVLDHARRAVYEEMQVAPIPAALRKKYLMRSRDHSSGLVRISPTLREKVSSNFNAHHGEPAGDEAERQSCRCDRLDCEAVRSSETACGDCQGVTLSESFSQPNQHEKRTPREPATCTGLSRL